MADVTTPADNWLLAQEAAKYIKVSRSTFRTLIKNGTVVGQSLGPNTRKKYYKPDLEKLLTPGEVVR